VCQSPTAQGLHGNIQQIQKPFVVLTAVAIADMFTKAAMPAIKDVFDAVTDVNFYAKVAGMFSVAGDIEGDSES